jgi:hypothetical protein
LNDGIEDLKLSNRSVKNMPNKGWTTTGIGNIFGLGWGQSFRRYKLPLAYESWGGNTRVDLPTEHGFQMCSLNLVDFGLDLGGQFIKSELFRKSCEIGLKRIIWYL